MPDVHSLGKARLPYLLLAFFILIYTIYFSWYTINRHDTLNSYAADLSLIDQPMWNTVIGPGGFMEQTWGDRQQPRLAEHFEPILVPLALLFFVWDNVRILLIAQSLALALGAVPVFWIGRDQFKALFAPLPSQAPRSDPLLHPTPSGPIAALPAWIALVFAGVYLLFPHLQAANVADFHADPFVVTPLLFAFWYAGQRRWRWMWFWAIIAMLTKETLPTLTAMLGLYLLFDYLRTQWSKSRFSNYQLPITNYQPFISTPQVKHALALILVSTAWFLIATFLIVAPLARHYYGTDGPIYLANRFSDTLSLPQLLQEPARWRYLFGLFAAVGFLPLLAPELLLLGLPVLAANLLSNFPGQYSGEQHYSAPLVAAFVVAAIYATRRLAAAFSPQPAHRATALLGLALWLAMWSIGYHARHGWTPFSIRTEHYEMSAAARQLPELIKQIPAEAIVSASPGLHPHIAHRRVAYLFPTVENADYLLVDVTDISGVHPNDVRSKIETLLEQEWQLRQSGPGLILAQRSAQPPPNMVAACPGMLLPCSFFEFAHATTPPTYPVSLSFGDGRLQLLGYDVNDDPDDGVVFRFYWQATAPLPDDLKLWPLIYDDTGRLLSDPTQVPMVATVWYPPSAWPSDEIIVTETLPQPLPDSFHLGLAVGPAASFNDPDLRYPIEMRSDAGALLYLGNWAKLAGFTRQGPFLTALPPEASQIPLDPIRVQFGPAIHLTGYRLVTHDDSSLQLLLAWVTTQPLATNLTVFVHLVAPDGTLVGQSDAVPRWLTPQPTSQWPLHQPLLDSHLIPLPDNLPPATYTLRLGLYSPKTLERLPLPDGTNALELGQVRLE